MKEVLLNTIIVSVFVTAMMIILEFTNIASSGKWIQEVKKRKWLQVPLAAIFGMVPGCIGVYAMVSLYTHRVIGLGALTALLIATSGDEAFFMLSASPALALKVFSILIIVAIVVGYIVNLFEKKNPKKECDFEIHSEHSSDVSPFKSTSFKNALKSISKKKAIILISFLLFIICVLTGVISHEHFTVFTPNDHDHVHTSECSHDHSTFGWFQVSLLAVSLINLVIVFFADSHFINDHIWNHVIKKHFLKIFIWTLLAMSIIVYLNSMWKPDYVSEVLHSKYYFILLAVAILVGIIPESGPHLIFVTLFFQGTIPFGILIANSIVQDGHGALPLLAESKIDFIKTKLINMLVGLIVGSIFYFVF